MELTSSVERIGDRLRVPATGQQFVLAQEVTLRFRVEQIYFRRSFTGHPTIPMELLPQRIFFGLAAVEGDAQQLAAIGSLSKPSKTVQIGIDILKANVKADESGRSITSWPLEIQSFFNRDGTRSWLISIDIPDVEFQELHASYNRGQLHNLFVLPVCEFWLLDGKTRTKGDLTVYFPADTKTVGSIAALEWGDIPIKLGIPPSWCGWK